MKLSSTQKLARVCSFLVVVMLCLNSFGQLKGRLAEQPMAVGYMRNLTQARMFDYMKELSEQTKVGETVIKNVPAGRMEDMNTVAPDPISGVAWYLVQGLIPSFDQIYFQEVVDVEDAKRMLRARSKMFGSNSALVEKGDNFFLLEHGSTSVMDVPGGQDAEEYATLLRQDNDGYSVTADVFEENGKEKIRYRWSRPEYYRFDNSMLFSCWFEELKDINLPTKESLTSKVSTNNDIGAEASFDRIPEAIKQLGWNMLNATAGTQMQPRDEEDAVDANLRRTGITTGLDIVRSIMFDVDSMDLFVRFATEEVQDVQAQIDFNARRASGLTTQLEEISSASSRLAPVLNDNAAVTIHTCFRLSKEAAETIPAFAEWVKSQSAKQTANNTLVAEAAEQFALSLGEIGETRDVEAMIKLGHSDRSGGVIYGGIQVGNNPALLESLFRLKTMEGVPQAAHDAISLESDQGIQFIHLQLPEPEARSIQQSTSLYLTDAFLAHRGSCLWFAVGGPNAAEMIHTCLSRCESTGRAARTPLFTFNFSADTWLNYPQDDVVGVGGLLRWLDANRFEFPYSPLIGQMMMATGQNVKPTPLLEAALAMGGNRDFKATVISDGSGARLRVDLGEAIANYYVIRMLDMQEKVFSSIQPEAATADEADVEVKSVP